MANVKSKRKDIIPVDEVMAETDAIESKLELKEFSVKEGTVCNCTSLNIRKEPSLNAEILMFIRHGEKVKVLDEVDDWYKLSVSNIVQGYSMKEFIELDK